MILRLERVSAKARILSSFQVITLGDDLIMSFIDAVGYRRSGIKTVLINHVFTTKKYCESNCDNLLKYIQR